jgi:ribosomal protein L21E
MGRRANRRPFLNMTQNKRYVVLPRNPSVQKNGITTGKGHRAFRGKSGLVISDPAEAREIETAYGREGNRTVSIIEDERLGWHYEHDRQTDGRNSDIHHYVFSGVDLRRVKRTKKSAYVWARVDFNRLRHMPREEALEEGYEIVED